MGREERGFDLFLRLYVEHEESLRGFVRSLVHTLEDSREGMQDVAAVLWRRIEDITSMDDFRRRAFGVARFVAMEFLRTRRRDRRVFGDDALRLLAVASEESEDAFEAERRALDREPIWTGKVSPHIRIRGWGAWRWEYKYE